ncbi:hypothetical protein SNE35_29835 [Paucibacter sp. R3-3]|uniref:Uncharacterized protein n=1 Tax=Roseateles agri TaxID=3098619 RepID=A0ABU5DTW0_9BURK|nr:hypothetical protein [Paucibacter sp. R3-3]MDY0748737.1 hypothetical protein [Paucibacter sp. R3-3]
MQLIKSTYINSEHVAGTIRFLRDLLDGMPFPHVHAFAVRDRKLPQDYPHLRMNGAGKAILSITSLPQAFDCYWWDRADFATNARKLSKVQTRVLEAWPRGDTLRPSAEVLLDAIRAVLEWGAGGKGLRLYRENARWAEENVDTLFDRLDRARASIEAEEVADLSVFGRADGARMNAGFTKFFALGCAGSIIYDGRVGAALGLIVRMYCERERLASVPVELEFRWGAQVSAGKTQPLPRNPSAGPFAFPALNTSDRVWAKWNIQANWILCKALRGVSAEWCAPPDGLRRVEAALFTLGYQVLPQTL